MSIQNNSLNPINNVIASAFGGVVVGAIYAVFAKLPVAHAAQAYGICGAIGAVFTELAVAFASLFTKRTSTFLFVRSIVGGTSSALMIKSLREMKLMGDKMLAFSVIVNVIALTTLSVSAIVARKNGH